jgi:hypothetical protein
VGGAGDDGFPPAKEEDLLRAIARRNEGRFKQVKAEDY